MKEPQSWVTYASDDREALKALILSRSLRHVITRRSLTVFVAQDVSEEICELLEFGFHRCIRMTNKYSELRYPGLSFGSVAKIRCWGLANLEKIVFLEPSSFVLKNPDELFRYDGLMGSDGSDGIGMKARASIFIGTPSENKFKRLFNAATKTSSPFGTGELKCLEKSCGLKIGGKWLMEKYNASVNFRNAEFECDPMELCIVNFTDGHPIDYLMATQNGYPKIESIFPEGTVQRTLYDVCVEHFPAHELLGVKEILPKPMQMKVEGLCQNPPPQLKQLDELRHSIAIVGIGMRLPQTNNLDEFWDLLINGKDGITRVPPARWNPEHCFNRSENTTNTRAGFLKCPVDELDGKFFGLSPLELIYMDPQQRLSLLVLWEALEHAGISPTSLKNTNTGVFGGWWRHDYKEMLQESGLDENEFFRTYMGNSLGTLTGRISHTLDLTGPSISTESGCSTAVVAVDMACKTLLNEDCDLSLVFGVNLLLHPFSDETLNSVIAPDGHCKTFDAKADGFGRAEGCVTLILKRFPDAVRDGDRIHALIRGSAVVQEGPSRSMGTPTKGCEALAMTLALEDAGVEPKEVSFVETHGTGTPVGDPLEVAAVAEAYSKDREEPLIIGSVKTNIGHTESCCGIAGIIKTVLALQHEVIPPHINFETLNPDIKLEAIPAVISLSPVKWPRVEGKPRIAGVSSFGITGTDAHVIMQEAPDEQILPKRSLLTMDSKWHTKILKLSAKSPEALEEMANSMKLFLRNTHEDYDDICYTANVGRSDFQYRTVVVGNDKADVITQLQKKSFTVKQIPSQTPKLCFLFTGQGSQYPEMAKSLYKNSPIFRLNFDTCANILLKDYSINIKDAMWGTQKANLVRTIYSQTSIFCVEYALFKLWESLGIKPDFVLGHSLGEFCATVAAGIISLQDGLKLVAGRGRLIDDLPGGKMIVLKKSMQEVEILLKTACQGLDESVWLDYAALNSPEQTVLAGTEDNINRFAEFCTNNDVKTHILLSTHAFHSRMMDPVQEESRQIAQSVTYNKQSTCTFVSGMEGTIFDADKMDAEYWVRHAVEPVRFINASKSVLEFGATRFLEIGPQPILCAMMMYNVDTVESVTEPIVCMPSIRKNEEELQTMLTSLGTLYTNGYDINWKNFYRFTQNSKVTLPNYPFQNKSYWFDVQGGRERPIHPLVGTQAVNPSPLKLFHHNLNIANAKFLKDHVIGNTIIFPGAGFLEMCLVGGHAAFHCLENDYSHPVVPVSLEDFTIEAPLALSEGEKTHFQTMVSREDSGEIRVTIYSKLVLDKETHKWIRHSSALFSPYAVQWEGENQLKKETLESIKARCTEVVDRDTYEKFTTFGLKFGPYFQTLQDACKCTELDELYFKLLVTDKSNSYISHPIVADAMLQAIMIASNPNADSLHVPVSVSKFIWYNRIKTDTGYIHVKLLKTEENPNGDYTATLYDELGQKLAVMTGTTFIETTVATILAGVEAQRTSLPTMYEDIWKEQMGHWDRRIDPMPPFSKLFSPEYKQSLAYYDNLPEKSQLVYDNANVLCMHYVIKALYYLGWNPRVGTTFTLQQLLKSLKIAEEFTMYMRFMTMELVKEGYLTILSISGREDVEFKVVKEPMSRRVIAEYLQNLYIEMKPDDNPEVFFFDAVGRNLAEILTKEVSGLSILFPGEEEKGSAETYYRDSEFMRTSGQLFTSTSETAISELISNINGKDERAIIRILEIGAGTGSLTRKFLEIIEKNNPSAFEYTFTDLSAGFFSRGEEVFENSLVKVNYKVLNIEEDPTTQGFIPQSYDIVFAGLVIHATENVNISIAHIRNLLRPQGLAVINELTTPNRGINMCFGVVEGFWRFKDFDIRPFNCAMDKTQWEMVFRQNNFDQVVAFGTYSDHGAVIWAQASESNQYISCHVTNKSMQKPWLVFMEEGSKYGEYITQKLIGLGRDVRTVYPGPNYQKLNPKQYQISMNEVSGDLKMMLEEICPDFKKNLGGLVYLWGCVENTEDYESICRPYLSLCKTLVTFDQIKLFVVTKGISSIIDHDVSLPSTSPLWSMSKTLHNENPNLACRCIEIDPGSSISEAMDEAFSEFFIEDHEPFVAYREKKRHVHRFLSCKLQNNKLTLPKSERFKLILPSSNAIRDLRFGVAEKPSGIGPNEVEVRVKAYALNFRDMFVVLKPDSQFDNLNTVGIDYSGEVVAVGEAVTNYKIGDNVFGLNLHGDPLPSHITVCEDLLAPIPNDMTFCEAATLPTVAVTSYLCLLSVANIQENETVLIHTGSGGVGLCAIQLAQARKCNIIATAGSVRKRAYLRNLGIKHVFHSRNTEYEHDIREALGGNKVDVVLNSLTSPGFKEASLSVCRQGGRFIEMSKLNTWTPKEVRALRPDVFYKIADLSPSTEAEMKNYISQVREFVGKAEIRPIPYVRFDVTDIREALTYMQKAKHIGKIVCVMPDSSRTKAGTYSELKIPMFNDRSTYLITGGLGGIGMEVAKWMTQSGAKYVILASRNKPNEKVADEINRMNSHGASVINVQCDVGQWAECLSLMDWMKAPETGLPPLRGVMHAAGVLSDASFENQTWEKYMDTFNPKVEGGWNLHKLTLGLPLEHFVMFSSAVSLFGCMGQSNHGSANYFLDSLTYYRQAIGLSGTNTTIQWGQWSQVGVAAHVDLVGIKPMTPLQGISALEGIMKANRLQTCVLQANFNIMRKAFPIGKIYFKELKEGTSESVEGVQVNGEEFWKEYNATDYNEERVEIVSKFLRFVVRRILKLDENEAIDDNGQLQDMGMDSLMMIEMKNVLQAVVGSRAKITVNSVKDCFTIAQLATRVVELVSGVDEPPIPTREEFVQLIREDAPLPSNIQPRGKPYCKPSLIRTVLITGVTGNLGPYMLREISRRPHIQKIYCLIKPNQKVQPQQRIIKVLAEKGLASQIRLEIVEGISGNFTQEKFGLPQETYDMLSTEVDAIFHMGVRSVWQEMYRKGRINDSDIRTVNVLGTTNVLEFASVGKTKHFYYSSSTLTAATMTDGRLGEMWPNVKDFDELPNDAYAVSKFICELRLAQAVERGIPCKVFRFPMIGGDSQTGGNISALNNQIMLRAMTYLSMGVMPAYKLPIMLVPVDICAELSSQIFFEDGAEFDVYHVSNPNANDEQEFEDISEELGYPVEVVEIDEFIDKLEATGDSELMLFFKRGLENSEFRDRLEDNLPPAALAWIAGQKDVFVSRKLERFLPNRYPQCMESSLEILKRDLKYCKQSGIFSKLGLK